MKNLRVLYIPALLLVGTVTRLAAAAPESTSPPATAPALGSTVFSWDELKSKPTPVGIYRAVADAPTPTFDRVEMHVTTLKPGAESHPPHHHPQEELILLKDGTVESFINGKKERVGAGSLFFFAAHDLHNLSNIGTEPATYYVINFYTTATGTVRDQPAAQWADSKFLKSSVIDWAKLQPQQSGGGTRRTLVNSPTLTFANLEIHATTLPAGAPASTPHRHPWAQLLILKEGSVQVTLDGKTQTAPPYSIVYIAPNTLQNLQNTGSGPATYYVFSVSSEKTAKSSPES